MTRALKILAVVIAAVLCQTNLSALVRLQSIAPDFMIAALVALAFHYGTYGGFCAGAVMGLLYDSAVGYVLALNIIIYTFIGYAAPAGKALLQGKVPVRRRRKWLEALILGFILNYAAYFAEIYRGGIESMPVGQYEAAEVLGYTKAQTFLRIILPQVIKRIMPSVTNEVITLVKDTSLAFTLAYQEVFSLAKQISASQTSFMPFVIAGVFYFVANYGVQFLMERIEKTMDYYR